MTEQTTPLAALHEEFDRARGVPMDGVWAYAVSWRLMRRDVEPELVCEGLEEALAVVRETQESPRELFGSPEEHSGALYDRWVDEGRLRLWDASRTTWGEVPSTGLAVACFLTVGFLGIYLAKGETILVWRGGMVLLPVGIGLAQALLSAVWGSLLRARGYGAAVAGSAATTVGVALVLGTANELLKPHPLGTASVWWYVPTAAACALGATAWRRWRERRPAPSEAVIADADAWSRELAAILRSRYRMPDARVQRVIGDAHALADDSGRTVEEEFGSPEDYAATFRPDLTRQHLWNARMHGTLAVLWLLPLLWGATWGPVLAAAWAWLAWTELRRARDLGQSGL